MRKIGITGGGGFIGSWVTQRAVEMGYEVVVLDRTGSLTGSVGRLVETGTGAVFLGDVRDSTAMAELGAHVDGIIHLAACLGTQETIKNPFPAAETNIVGGLNFLEACAQYDIPGVYIGVGNHWMNNSYSITKTTVERFVHMYNKERGTRVNTVRLVNAYGPGQSVAPPFGPAKVRKITPAFVCRALTGAPIEVYGDGNQISDMVHVSDGATALIKALEAAAEGRVITKPIEVGPAESLTVNQVADIIRHAAAQWRIGRDVAGLSPLEMATFDANDLDHLVGIVHLPMRPGEVPGDKVTADWTTMESIGMSYRDLVRPEEGLAATVRWYAENWLPDYLAVAKDPVVVPEQRRPELVANRARGVRMMSEEELADNEGPRFPDLTATQAHGQDH